MKRSLVGDQRDCPGRDGLRNAFPNQKGGKQAWIGSIGLEKKCPKPPKSSETWGTGGNDDNNFHDSLTVRHNPHRIRAINKLAV